MTLAQHLNRLPNKAGAALVGLYVISQSSIAVLLGHKVGPELIKLQLAFTKPRFDSVVGSWTEANLQEFQNHFYLDFFHPVWYGLMLAWALAKTLPPNRRSLVWIPIVAALCDMCENTIHAVPTFQGTFQELSQPWIAISSCFAATKWLLALISIIFIVVCFIRGRLRRQAKDDNIR